MVTLPKELRPELLSIEGDYEVACFQQKFAGSAIAGNMHRTMQEINARNIWR